MLRKGRNWSCSVASEFRILKNQEFTCETCADEQKRMRMEGKQFSCIIVNGVSISCYQIFRRFLPWHRKSAWRLCRSAKPGILGSCLSAWVCRSGSEPHRRSRRMDGPCWCWRSHGHESPARLPLATGSRWNPRRWCEPERILFGTFLIAMINAWTIVYWIQHAWKSPSPFPTCLFSLSPLLYFSHNPLQIRLQL